MILRGDDPGELRAVVAQFVHAILELLDLEPTKFVIYNKIYNKICD